jgi:hypothetical protein
LAFGLVAKYLEKKMKMEGRKEKNNNTAQG